MKTILISGATGLVGKKISQELKKRNYTVRSLSRNRENGYYWNPEKNEIDIQAFENLDAIIHLAGAAISKRWTKKYKQEIFDSRIKTAELLFDYSKKYAPNLKTFITASGTNYYGTFNSEKVFVESDSNADDFLGKLCRDWENAAMKFESLGTRVAMVRTAAVLSTQNGILSELIPLTKRGLASPIGSGKQIIPWIHLQDLASLYIYILENENLKGAYNAVAPDIINNKEFIKNLASQLNKTAFLPNIPGFILKLILGEMSGLALYGSAISAQKIKDAGFDFLFPNFKSALDDFFK